MRSLPTPPRPGERVSASLIRDIINAIRERTPIEGEGVRLSRGPNGTVFKSKHLKSENETTVTPFSARYVEIDATAGITYTGWEIYLPAGCVNVNASCAPLNPQAYRMKDSDGTVKKTYLDGWYRMPEPILDWGSRDEMFKYVRVTAMCDAAHYGGDEIDTWPLKYAWAEICEASDGPVPGRTFESYVGTVKYTKENGTVKREYNHTVSSNISCTANTDGRFELVHSFSVDDDDVDITLEMIYVRNPSFEAAGKTWVMEDLDELDCNFEIEEEHVYLKIDTQTGTASLVVYSEQDGESIEDQVLDDTGPFDIMICLYVLNKGCVLHDLRQNLNNIQIYK